MAKKSAARGGIGDNSGLSAEQEEALFLNARGPIRRLKDQIASLTGKLRKEYQKAKADGFSKKDIDFSFECEKDKDGELLARRNMETKIAGWMGHPLGQMELFAPQPDRRPLDDKSFDDGKTAGMESATGKPPQGVANPDRWMEGWHAGQSILAGAIKQKKETSDQQEAEAAKKAKEKADRAAAKGKGGKRGKGDPKPQGGKTFSQQMREKTIAEGDKNRKNGAGAEATA